MSKNAISILRFPAHLAKSLQAEADAAFKAHQLAESEFWRYCATQNIGWQVQEAGDKQYIARQALIIALIRLNDFMRPSRRDFRRHRETRMFERPRYEAHFESSSVELTVHALPDQIDQLILCFT